ncbi:MAG: hypothetical protein F6K56_42650 [Moorea sp. SIO3G5]|nr:hypothetical protein [Moorena sp. SIO3G5]
MIIFVPCSLFPVPCSLSYTSSQWGGDKIILSFSNAITGVNWIFFLRLIRITQLG